MSVVTDAIEHGDILYPVVGYNIKLILDVNWFYTIGSIHEVNDTYVLFETKNTRLITMVPIDKIKAVEILPRIYDQN